MRKQYKNLVGSPERIAAIIICLILSGHFGRRRRVHGEKVTKDERFHDELLQAGGRSGMYLPMDVEGQKQREQQERKKRISRNQRTENHQPEPSYLNHSQRLSPVGISRIVPGCSAASSGITTSSTPWCGMSLPGSCLSVAAHGGHGMVGGGSWRDTGCLAFPSDWDFMSGFMQCNFAVSSAVPPVVPVGEPESVYCHGESLMGICGGCTVHNSRQRLHSVKQVQLPLLAAAMADCQMSAMPHG